MKEQKAEGWITSKMDEKYNIINLITCDEKTPMEQRCFMNHGGLRQITAGPS